MGPRSRQGRAVLDALHALDHPTADEVFLHVREAFPKISLGTVYRNLDAIVREGRARVREGGGAKRYDVNVEAHIHLHDTASDRLVDVPITPRLRKALDDVAAQYLGDHEDSIIELRGTLRKTQ